MDCHAHEGHGVLSGDGTTTTPAIIAASRVLARVLDDSSGVPVDDSSGGPGVFSLGTFVAGSKGDAPAAVLAPGLSSGDGLYGRRGSGAFRGRSTRSSPAPGIELPG